MSAHCLALNITPPQMIAFWRAAWNSNMGEIRRLNVEMNGPRVIWGRMTALTLSLFILFKEHNQDSEHDTVQIIGSISYFVDKVSRKVFKQGGEVGSFCQTRGGLVKEHYFSFFFFEQFP